MGGAPGAFRNFAPPAGATTASHRRASRRLAAPQRSRSARSGTSHAAGRPGRWRRPRPRTTRIVFEPVLAPPKDQHGHVQPCTRALPVALREAIGQETVEGCGAKADVPQQIVPLVCMLSGQVRSARARATPLRIRRRSQSVPQKLSREQPAVAESLALQSARPSRAQRWETPRDSPARGQPAGTVPAGPLRGPRTRRTSAPPLRRAPTPCSASTDTGIRPHRGQRRGVLRRFGRPPVATVVEEYETAVIRKGIQMRPETSVIEAHAAMHEDETPPGRAVINHVDEQIGHVSPAVERVPGIDWSPERNQRRARVA